MLNKAKSAWGGKTFITIAILLLSSGSSISQWTQTATPDGGGITDMVVLNDGIIIATTSSFNWPTGQQGGIRRSTNGGASWQNVVNVYNGRTLHVGSTGKIFASYWNYPSVNEGMYYSTNGGLNWVQSYVVGANDNVFSITSKNNDSTIFIGTRFGVWRKINNGAWQFVSNGIPANTFVYDLDVSYNGNYIAAGTSKGLYLSSNNGTNWSAVSGISQTDTIYTIEFAHYTTDAPGDILYAGTTDGELYQAMDDFILATLVETFFELISEIQVFDESGNNSFIGLSFLPFGADNLINPGFAYSTNRGVSWTQNNNGLPSSPRMSALTYQVQGSNIRYYAGLFENTNGGAKIYKMDFPIGIQQISSEVPNAFSLSQNYPNPFNPMTKIKFSVTKASNVSVTVFDVLGRHITTLVNEKLGAGTYETEWNANNMPGGVYFYKLETEDFSETKKMILIK